MAKNAFVALRHGYPGGFIGYEIRRGIPKSVVPTHFKALKKRFHELMRDDKAFVGARVADCRRLQSSPGCPVQDSERPADGRKHTLSLFVQNIARTLRGMTSGVAARSTVPRLCPQRYCPNIRHDTSGISMTRACTNGFPCDDGNLALRPTLGMIDEWQGPAGGRPLADYFWWTGQPKPYVRSETRAALGQHKALFFPAEFKRLVCAFGKPPGTWEVADQGAPNCDDLTGSTGNLTEGESSLLIDKVKRNGLRWGKRNNLVVHPSKLVDVLSRSAFALQIPAFKRFLTTGATTTITWKKGGGPDLVDAKAWVNANCVKVTKKTSVATRTGDQTAVRGLSRMPTCLSKILQMVDSEYNPLKNIFPYALLED